MEFGIIVETEGWAAIGISQTGGMSKSDMVMGYIDDEGQTVLQNWYRDAAGNGFPTLFTDQSGIQLIEGWNEVIDGSTLLYLRFIKDTFPSSDREFAIDIPIGTARVIYAWNDNLPFGYHGPLSRGTESMNLLAGDSIEVPLPEDAAFYDLLQPNVSIPAKDTTYMCTLLQFPAFEDEQHIVRIDPITQAGNEGIVHHHIVNVCPVRYFDPDYLNQAFDCDDYANMATNASHCRNGVTFYGWAVGGKNFYFPEHVGLLMGGTTEDRIQYVLLETHYDNPSEEEGFVDSSGLRFWYTPTLREESAVAFIVVDGYDQWIPPGYVGKNYAFASATCTTQGLPEEGIKIFAASHHQHLLGRAGILRHIRDGVELKPIDVNEAYDFDYQQSVPLQEEVTVLPGDELIVKCTLDATERTANTYGGESTRDEMCGYFLLVYPPPLLASSGSIFIPEEKEEFIADAIQRGYYDNLTDIYDVSMEGAIEFYEEFQNLPTRYMYCSDVMGNNIAADTESVPQGFEEYNMSDYIVCNDPISDENSSFAAWDEYFDHKAFVTPDENFLIYWTSDLNECKMEFGIVVETEGWAAIGISQTGGMSKSDIVMGYIDDNGDAVLQNWYRDEAGNGWPTLFTDQSGIELVEGWKDEIGGVTRLYLRFTKDTFPSSDREFAIDIPIGTARMIYAWSDVLPFGYHGPNRGTESMNLLSGDLEQVEMPANTKYVDILQPNVAVPTDDTTYWCTLLALPEYEEAQHIIRIDPVTQPGNEGIVHHHVVNICPERYVDLDYIGRGFECNEYANMATNASHCRSGTTLYSWAIGRKAFYFPEDVGLEMSGSAEDRIQYVLIETHYDNPFEEEGYIDSSGLRFYYTPTRREQSAAVMAVFDGYDQFIPPGFTTTNYAYAVSECTQEGLHEEGVKIIAAAFHTHLLGRSGIVRHIRDGVELRPIDVNEAYDFDFQQYVPLQEEITLLPGDEIIVECTIDSTDREYNTYGGQSTRDEMCGVNMMVYPPPLLRGSGSVFNSGDKQQFIQDAIERGYFNESGDVYDVFMDGAIEFYEEFHNLPQRLAYCSNSMEERIFIGTTEIPQEYEEYDLSDFVVCGEEQPREDEDGFDWNAWYVYLIGIVVGLLLIAAILYLGRKIIFPKKRGGLPNYQEMGATTYGATEQ